jgi:hypothetical protein
MGWIPRVARGAARALQVKRWSNVSSWSWQSWHREDDEGRVQRTHLGLVWVARPPDLSVTEKSLRALFWNVKHLDGLGELRKRDSRKSWKEGDIRDVMYSTICECHLVRTAEATMADHWRAGSSASCGLSQYLSRPSCRREAWNVEIREPGEGWDLATRNIDLTTQEGPVRIRCRRRSRRERNRRDMGSTPSSYNSGKVGEYRGWPEMSLMALSQRESIAGS